MVTRRHTLALFAAGAALGLAGVAFAPTTPRPSASASRRAACWRSPRRNGAIEAAPRGPRHRASTWNEFTSGPPLLEALGAGALDFGSTGDVPPLFAQAAGGDLLYVAADQGRGRRLGDPGQEGQPDQDACRSQGQERRLQARLVGAQFHHQGAREGRPHARRHHPVRPRAARCRGGVRQRPDRCLGDLGSRTTPCRRRTRTRASWPPPRASSTPSATISPTATSPRPTRRSIADVLDELKQDRRRCAGPSRRHRRGDLGGRSACRCRSRRSC